MHFFKKSKEPQSSLLTAKVSNTFDYTSQVNFNTRSERNFKSIFSYQSFDTNEDEYANDQSYKAWTIMFGFLLVIFFPVLGWFSVKIVTKNKKLVVYRCGKLWKISDPGLTFTIPFIDSCQFIDTEINHCCINDASCATRDQGLIEMDCLIKYRILEPEYLLRSVIDWKDYVAKEMRLGLTDAVSYFRWCDFEETRIYYDIETQLKKYLAAKDSTRGLEIKSVSITNVRQGREPETPMDILKKINFKDLGRHLSSMTPMFMNNLSVAANSRGATIITPPPVPPPILTDPDNSDPQKNKAIEEFFEKLEIMKNLALNSQQKLEKPLSQSQPMIINQPQPGASNRNSTEIRQMFVVLLKDFIKKNMTWSKAMQVIQENSLKQLFEDDSENIQQMSIQIEQLARVCDIEGSILFVVTKYFKEPCYFHWAYDNKMLQNGKIDQYSFEVTID